MKIPKIQPETVLNAWKENDKNTQRTARALGISESTVRVKLREVGAYENKILMPKKTIRTKATETQIKEFFKLKPGDTVWVTGTRGPRKIKVEQVHRHLITTKNKYNRIECFTYADVLTGYFDKNGKGI